MVLNIEVAAQKFCISIATVFLRGQAECEMKGKGRKTLLRLIFFFCSFALCQEISSIK